MFSLTLSYPQTHVSMIYTMDATNMATFTDIVGIGYHLQEQLVHPKAVMTITLPILWKSTR